jgi:hypothetical protein
MDGARSEKNGTKGGCKIPEILTPAHCGSNLRPARSAPPGGPAQVRFFLFFLLFSFSIFLNVSFFFLNLNNFKFQLYLFLIF